MPRLLACASALAMLAATGAGSAAAQTPAADPAAEGEEEVIVTAQRVRENLQKVPLAVSAFNAQKLADNNIQTLADLSLRVPGFSMTVVDPIQSNYAIRGIGSAHGIWGFKAFSHERAVVRTRIMMARMFFPPYTDFKLKLIQLTKKIV